MLEKIKKPVRALPGINTSSDTRDILSHATQQSKQNDDYFLVDIDAHVTETQFWPEILASIDNDFIRHMGEAGLGRPVSRSLALLNNVPGMSYQSVYGRIRTNRRGSKPSPRRTATHASRWCVAPWTRSGSTIRSCSRHRC